MSLASSNSDGLGGRGETLTPVSGGYENVVVWMHGLGDTCSGWAQGMPSLNVSNTKFILPTASPRPISINGGYSMPGWSDIYGLDSDSPEDSEGFSESAKRINALIDNEISNNGIDPKKIVVAGFSQGGALALHVSLRYPVSLGGCVALSSWIPLRNDYPATFSDAQKSIPIIQVHGNADQVVAYQWGELSNSFLKTLITSPEPQFHTIQGMGHSSHPEEMKIVSEFINGIFKN